MNSELFELYNKSIQSKSGTLKIFSAYVNKKDHYKNLLIESTNFLPESASIKERIYCCVNNVNAIPSCPFCGNPRRFSGRIKTGYHGTCGSKICMAEGVRAGSLHSAEKRKNDDVRKAVAEKAKHTYFERTGYTHNMRNPTCISSREQKCIETWGVSHPSKIKDIRDKAVSTTKARYGSADMFHSDKAITTIIDKYGSVEKYNKIIGEKRGKLKSARSLIILSEKIKAMGCSIISADKEMLTLKCDKCGLSFTISRTGANFHYRNHMGLCPKCNYKDMTFRSRFEKSIGDEINKIYNGEIQYNRYIGGTECDIIIPDKKLAIEANGLYWHSELYKDKNYHQDKKRKVESAGYNLIYIWEDDWNDSIKKDIIISRIKSKMGLCDRIFARKCKVVKYTKSDIKSVIRPFLNTNHLQGYVNGNTFYGLEYNGELVELIEFGKTRKNISGNTDNVELLRLCTKNGKEVIGGFSRLLKYAVNDAGYDHIISYADLDWAGIERNSYKSVGFIVEHITSPNYWWCIGNHRENRLKYTKHNLVKSGYDSVKTEVEIMHELKHYRIYGSGNIKLTFN